MRRRPLLLLVLLATTLPSRAQTQREQDFERLFVRALELHRAADIIGAVEDYMAAPTLIPDRVGALSNPGAAYVRLGQFDVAIQQYLAAFPAGRLARPSATLAFHHELPGQKPPSRKPPAPTRTSDFDKLVQAATEARQAERWTDAVELYNKIVELEPDYVEGYWYLGTAYYTLDESAQCRNAFRRVVSLAPKNGAAHAFLGLCEFGLKEYDRALQNLLRSRTLGVGDTGELGGVARYHAGILMTRSEQYERALETLGEFAAEGNDNPRVIEALGIATLRMPSLPVELPPDRREMVLMAGRASFLRATRNRAAAEKAFEALVTRYPETPNVHYAFGEFLLLEKGERAIEEFKRELELQPHHPASLVQIALEYLTQGDAATALPFAKKAVEIAPKEFPARKALGQALLETGDAQGAIKELETGIKLAPDSPGLHFQLARAYQRAGRLEDASRAREEFTRLDRIARAQKSGARSVGGHIERH